MVPVLVFLTIAAFLLIDWYRIRRRRRAAHSLAVAGTATAPSGPWAAPDMFFHPGQTWARISPDGIATMGVCDVVAHLAGELADISLPGAGEPLQRGETAWILASKKGRTVSQAPPLAGKVLAVNQAVRQSPRLLMDDPYGRGWLLKARIADLGSGLDRLLGGEAARQWMEQNRMALASALQPALGHAALDGGDWRRAFGDELDDARWQQLREVVLGEPGLLSHVGPQPIRLY